MVDDQKVAEVYGKKGAKVADLDEAIVENGAPSPATPLEGLRQEDAAVGGTAPLAERITVS